MTELELNDIWASYGAERVLSSFDMRCRSGDITALCGASGSGKTTILSLAAGLLQAESGVVCEDGHAVNSAASLLPPHRRSIGFAFQAGVLWPHLTVRKHMEFVLRARGVPKAEWAARVEGLSASLDVAPLLAKYPGALSGGQQQRVNLARAFVARPQLLLLDEPLNHLDGDLRSKVWDIVCAHAAAGAVVLVAVHAADALPGAVDQVVILKRT